VTVIQHGDQIHVEFIRVLAKGLVPVLPLRLHEVIRDLIAQIVQERSAGGEKNRLDPKMKLQSRECQQTQSQQDQIQGRAEQNLGPQFHSSAAPGLGIM
jgi:hypothetical protein